MKWTTDEFTGKRFGKYEVLCRLAVGGMAEIFLGFARSGYWGFFYNKDIDSPSGPWGTKRVSPKPMVNAVAAFDTVRKCAVA